MIIFTFKITIPDVFLVEKELGRASGLFSRSSPASFPKRPLLVWSPCNCNHHPFNKYLSLFLSFLL